MDALPATARISTAQSASVRPIPPRAIAELVTTLVRGAAASVTPGLNVRPDLRSGYQRAAIRDDPGQGQQAG